MCLRSQSGFTGSCCKIHSVTRAALSGQLSSAVYCGLEAAKLLPRYSPGSHSGKLHIQVCSVTKSDVSVAFQLSIALFVDLFQGPILPSLFPPLL